MYNFILLYITINTLLTSKPVTERGALIGRFIQKYIFKFLNHHCNIIQFIFS